MNRRGFLARAAAAVTAFAAGCAMPRPVFAAQAPPSMPPQSMETYLKYTTQVVNIQANIPARHSFSVFVKPTIAQGVTAIEFTVNGRKPRFVVKHGDGWWRVFYVNDTECDEHKYGTGPVGLVTGFVLVDGLAYVRGAQWEPLDFLEMSRRGRRG
jgi:hypothetical protein